jgi:branched-chain amino acid transport system substrate-binding protein
VDGALRIGYLLPTSGQSAAVGPPMIKGIEMAVRDINAAGGVNGEPVTLVS